MHSLHSTIFNVVKYTLEFKTKIQIVLAILLMNRDIQELC